eukprot:jgi/Bigna1/67422/fgenesh1_pg.3_\
MAPQFRLPRVPLPLLLALLLFSMVLISIPRTIHRAYLLQTRGVAIEALRRGGGKVGYYRPSSMLRRSSYASLQHHLRCGPLLLDGRRRLCSSSPLEDGKDVFDNPFGRAPPTSTAVRSSKEGDSGKDSGKEEAASDMSLLDFLSAGESDGATAPVRGGGRGGGRGRGRGSWEESKSSSSSSSSLPSFGFPRTDPSQRTGIVAHDPPPPEASSLFPAKMESKYATFESGGGVSAAVASALSNAGFDRPTLVQAQAIPHVRGHINPRNDHVVIAGPTGSGKTLAYLAPILSKLLESETTTTTNTRKRALILCPNVALARQVFEVAEAIVSNSPEEHPIRALGVQLVDSSITDIAETNIPHVVVSSTAQFLKTLEMSFRSKSSQKMFAKSLEFVVLDEADLQLSGSYQQELKNSPQFIFAAATLPDNSPKSAGTVLQNALPYARWVQADLLHQTLPSVTFRWLDIDNDANEGEIDEDDKDDDSFDFDEDDEEYDAKKPDPLALEAAARRIPLLSKAILAGPTRSIVFCNKIASADAIARGLDAIPGIRAEPWHREISAESRQDLLDEMRRMREQEEEGGGEGGEGQEGGGEGGPATERLVLVCTDAAARGIDLPRLGHVLQADFAGNAVDFLHRVGRTGRLGRKGVVTSIIDESSRDLALGLRAAIETGNLDLIKASK